MDFSKKVIKVDVKTTYPEIQIDENYSNRRSRNEDSNILSGTSITLNL
jgi:hypothetical protein